MYFWLKVHIATRASPKKIISFAIWIQSDSLKCETFKFAAILAHFELVFFRKPPGNKGIVT